MRTAGALLLLSAVVMVPAITHATLPEHLTDDPCADADAYDNNDDGPQARAARRRCRLSRFDAHQQAQVASAETEHADKAAKLQGWADTKLPHRATRPVSVDGFAGSGIAQYGFALNYLLITPLELGVWVGGASSDYYTSTSSIAYTRLAAGIRLRWLLLPRNLTPFVGAGFGFTQAPLNAYVPDPNADPNQPYYSGYVPSVPVEGAGRAHTVNGEAGLQLCYKGFRVALEYFMAFAYYTQANELNETNTENAALRLVWQESLDQSIHGVRFEVGYAF